MRDRKSQITLAVLFFILSFAITMQAKSIIKNNSSQNSGITRVEEANEELVKRDLQIEDLKNRLLAATNDLDNYRKEAEQNTDGAKAMASELERYKILAGLTDVEGKGITVTLSDSTAETDAGKNAASYIIHDSDLRTIVNELRSADAEAVSINGERLIASSEIRCVGPTVIINGKKYVPPFKIKAIGDPDMLEAALKLKGGIIDQLKSLYGFDIVISKSANLKIEKYSGIVSFKYAKTAE